MVTDKDRQIVRFVEENHSVTIDMCRRLLWNDRKSGYKIAQTRLSKLVDGKHLKVSRTETNENIYYINKKLSYHDLLTNHFYVGLLNCGAKIIRFDKDVRWMKDTFRSDALTQVDYGDNYYFFFLEVCWTHKSIPLRYYEELCQSQEGLSIINYKKQVPTLVVMDDSGHEYKSDIIKIVKIDYALNKLPLIFV